MCDFMHYSFPLTQISGKIRIKERLTFGDYGVSVAPRSTCMTHKHYIEWQIGYDLPVKRGEVYDFIGANGKPKILYELSSFLFSGFQHGLLSKESFQKLYDFISNNNELIDGTQNIFRTNFVDEKIAGITFLKSNVSYPLLVYSFTLRDAICEIVVREKQRASGVMPMLYFCLPFDFLLNGDQIIGRPINEKEQGILRVDSANVGLFGEMFRIFGILSEAHKHDCLRILECIAARVWGERL